MDDNAVKSEPDLNFQPDDLTPIDLGVDFSEVGALISSVGRVSLEGAVLSELDMSSDYWPLDFQDVSVERCGVWVDSPMSSFVDCSFLQSSLGKACLQSSRFLRLSFKKSSFIRTDFFRSSFSTVVFEECYFLKTMFAYCILKDVQFINCTFDRAFFGQSELLDVDFVSPKSNRPSFVEEVTVSGGNAESWIESNISVEWEERRGW